jgi:hypothetical protein
MKYDSWYKLRTTRDKYLAETDKYMISDFPIDTKVRGQYREYRVYLRNLPKMYNEESVKTAKVKTFQEYLEFRRNGDY